MDRHTASVVIPAHNEESVLARGLGTLLSGARADELEVIVVANACTDSTAEVAREHGVRVIETPVPGKAHALRLGDAAASTFPRLYARRRRRPDRRVGPRPGGHPGRAWCPRDVTGPALRPHAAMRPSARRLHKVHELLMADRRGLAGRRGLLPERGRPPRIAPFPDVISDDGFVHRSFAPGERVVSTGASSVVRLAPTFGASLRRRVRVRQGNQQLDALGLPLAEGRLRTRLAGRSTAGRKISPVDAGWYLALVSADRLQVWWRRLRGAEVSWGTDVSSRQATAVPLKGR